VLCRHRLGAVDDCCGVITAVETTADNVEENAKLLDLVDQQNDTYRCPAGQTLTRRKHQKPRAAYEYACAAATCRDCAMRSRCTRATNGAARTIKRHDDQEAIDQAEAQSHGPAA